MTSTSFSDTWTVTRNIPAPSGVLAVDDDWQDTQDFAGFRADSGALFLIAKPHALGILEVSMLLLDSSNNLIAPGKNSKLRIQLMEGVGLGTIPVESGSVYAQGNPDLRAPPIIMNATPEFDIQGEESVSSGESVRARMYLGMRAISLSGMPGGLESILVMFRYS